MNYGYIRVSSDKQTVENQRFEIEEFARQEGLGIDRWVEETISGTIDPKERRLGRLLGRIGEGDLIICSELSRLGRNLFMIMDVLNCCMSSGCKVWSIKDGYRLGDDVTSKALAFAFGLSAEIERNLISQRTKEALERRRNEGVKLGRPRGQMQSVVKLSGHEDEIRMMLGSGVSVSAIGRHFDVAPSTVSRFIRAQRVELDEAGATLLESRRFGAACVEKVGA